jgi:hypothetical protein
MGTPLGPRITGWVAAAAWTAAADLATETLRRAADDAVHSIGDSIGAAGLLLGIGSARGSMAAVSEPDVDGVVTRGDTVALRVRALTALCAGVLTPECLVEDLDPLRVATPAEAVLRACPTEGVSDPAAAGSAHATADPLKAAAPIPSATAKPPTRPIAMLATTVPPKNDS